MMFVGVDPDGHGGIAWVGCAHPGVCVMPMTKDRTPHVDAIRRLCGTLRPSVCIEQPLVLAPGGRKCVATKWRNFGILVGAFQALGCKVRLVEPREWQPFMAPGVPNGERRKPFLVATARRLFPDVAFTGSGPAEALLIAEYGRRTNGVASQKGSYTQKGELR